MNCATAGCDQPVFIKKRRLCRSCYFGWYRKTNPDRFNNYRQQQRALYRILHPEPPKYQPPKHQEQPMRPCKICGQPLTGRRRTYCSQHCSDLWRRRPGAWGQVSGPTNGRTGAQYEAIKAEVRARAEQGEACYFWGINPNCPYPYFDWALPHNDRHAFTVHHLHRIMDGGDPVPDSRLTAPAHRGCNGWDGLRAQNARRAGLHYAPAQLLLPERTSQTW